MLRVIYECPKPTIARVQGDVYAGGMGLVAACDIAVAVDTAEYCLSEVRAGADPRDHQPLRDPRHGRARGASLLPHRRALRRGRGPAHRLRARGGGGRRTRRQGGRARAGAGERRPGSGEGLQEAAARRGGPRDHARAGRHDGARASPTSAPATKAAKACSPSWRSASLPGCCGGCIMDAWHNLVDTPQLLALAAALGWASGVRLYVAVLLTGAGRLHGLDRPAAGPAGAAAPGRAGGQRLHGASSNSSPTRFPLARFALGHGPHGDPHPGGRGAGGGRARAPTARRWRWLAALLGGGLAATSHAAKMTTRAAVNTSPEPFSNVARVAGRGRVGRLHAVAGGHASGGLRRRA